MKINLCLFEKFKFIEISFEYFSDITFLNEAKVFN